WQAAFWLQLPAALALAGSFTLPAGLAAAVLALPWLGFTGLIAWMGLVSLVSRGPRPVEGFRIYSGFGFLCVGGAWTVVSRYGARPLGFSDLIVLATAVHFHYAGFVLPLLTGLAGRLLRSRTAQHAAVGVVLGVPLVAVGITLSALDIRWVEW